jgi:hypothetical protein
METAENCLMKSFRIVFLTGCGEGWFMKRYRSKVMSLGMFVTHIGRTETQAEFLW